MSKKEINTVVGEHSEGIAKDYVVREVYPFFVNCTDSNGHKAVFNTGDIVMSGVIDGGGK